jgi:hypothetical protein
MNPALFILLFANPNVSQEEAVVAVTAIRTQLVARAFEWTGIEERVASDPAIIDQISAHLHTVNVLIEQTGLSNLEKAKAHAINSALIKLIMSPEPEWQAIVNLLSTQSLNNIMGVANIVLFVFRLLGAG